MLFVLKKKMNCGIGEDLVVEDSERLYQRGTSVCHPSRCGGAGSGSHDSIVYAA